MNSRKKLQSSTVMSSTIIPLVLPSGDVMMPSIMIRLIPSGSRINNHCHVPLDWSRMEVWYDDVDGLVLERRNSIAYAMELCLSCTSLSIYEYIHCKKRLLVISYCRYHATTTITYLKPCIHFNHCRLNRNYIDVCSCKFVLDDIFAHGLCFNCRCSSEHVVKFHTLSTGKEIISSQASPDRNRSFAFNNTHDMTTSWRVTRTANIKKMWHVHSSKGAINSGPRALYFNQNWCQY